jgi:hypothetical protein
LGSPPLPQSPGQSLGEVLLGDEFFGCARRRTQKGKRLSLTSDGNIRCQLKTPYRESLRRESGATD